MKPIGRAKNSDLGSSQTELRLSQLMRSSQDGNAQDYQKLLMEISEMLQVFVTRSFHRFGLASSGGQEDVCQEILLALHTKRANYDPEQFFLPWMYAIARYKIIDYVRRGKNLVSKTVPFEEELETLENLLPLEAEIDLDIEALLADLPAKQREILKLVKLEDLSIAEVAQKTGYSASDIKVSTHRAIQFLRQKLKEKSHE